ncbi:MAG: response regulator [Clostridia bacterium]|nr:response regulator [Clostridia bacterium]
MNMLVVDDEKIILNGIINPVNWKDVALDKIYSATGADEAMDIIKQNSVDIVITDITMPGKTGLELCEEISRLYPDIYLIILSGYDYFEYAQKALTIGVREYLLKPATIEKIVEAVNRAIHVKNETIREKKRIREMEEFFTGKLDLLRENWILSLLKKGAPGTEELERSMELYDITLPTEGFSLAVIEVGDLSQSTMWQENDIFLVQFALLNIITELLQNYGIENIMACDMYNNIIVLYSSANHGLEDEWLAELENVTDDALEININYKVKKQCSFEKLRSEWSDIIDRLRHDGEIKIDISADNTLLNNTWMQSRKLEEAIIQSVFDGKTEETADYIDSLFEYFAKINDFIYLRSVCMGLFFVLSQRVPADDDGILADSLQRRDFVLKMRNADSRQKLKEYVTHFFTEAAQMIKTEKDEHSRDVVKTAKKYITANLDKDISLKQVASMVYMNSNYFSNLFKRKTGISFSDYVSERKISRAKELLTDRAVRILDIATQLGFKDQRYFSSFFKNHTGLTPTQYREENINNG